MSGDGFERFAMPDGVFGIIGYGTDRVYYMDQKLSAPTENSLCAFLLENGETEELYCFEENLKANAVWNNEIVLLLSEDGRYILRSVSDKGEIVDCASIEEPIAGSVSLLAGKKLYCCIGSTLYVLDETKKQLVPINNVLPEGLEAGNAELLQEEGDTLYLYMYGEMPGESGNTFLIQLDTDKEESTLLDIFYTP